MIIQHRLLTSLLMRVFCPQSLLKHYYKVLYMARECCTNSELEIWNCPTLQVVQTVCTWM